MRDVLAETGAESVEDKPFTPMVEVTVGYEDSGAHSMVQFINTTGHYGRSFFEPVTVNGICVRIPLQKEPKNVERLSTGEAMPFTWSAGYSAYKLTGLASLKAFLSSSRECFRRPYEFGNKMFIYKLAHF